MKKKKYIKSKIGILFGILNLLIGIFFMKNYFEIFLFFFIIFSVCLVYNRELVLIVLGRPIIKEICKLHRIKNNLQENIKNLETKKSEIMYCIYNNQENVNIINELSLQKKRLKIEVIKLEDKKQTIEEIIKQEELINRAIEGEERTFNILSQENIKLENEKEQLIKELKFLEKKSTLIKSKEEFLNKCSLNYVDNLNGVEFEKFCTKLLEINGYENVQNTQKSVDYGIDIIAEKDNIKYTIQCKRYQGKVGNDAIQEAMTGKEYYEGNIAIVLTNSTFTKNAQRLAKSAGVILWDRNILYNMLERNKKQNSIKY